MATRLVGVDSANPRLPQVTITATQGDTHADFAPGDIGLEANAYTDQRVDELADVVDTLVITGGGMAPATPTDILAGLDNTVAATPDNLMSTSYGAGEFVRGVSPGNPRFDDSVRDANVQHRVLRPSGDTTGVTDTAALQALIDALTGTGGKISLLGATYWVAGAVLKSRVWIDGVSPEGTIIKLPNGANTDVLVGEDFATLTGGTTTGGIVSWKLSDLGVDANRANNTSGWAMRVYGAKFQIDNVWFHDGKSGGVWSQWGTGGTNMESHWSNFKVYNCEGVVFDFNGPHDSLLVNGSIFNDNTQPSTTGKLLNVDTAAGGSQFTNIHAWGWSAYAVDIAASAFFANCQAEGATTAEVRVRANYAQWTGGHIFGTSTGTETGIQMGITSSTSVKGCRFENVLFSRYAAGSFPIRWAQSAGYNTISGSIGFPTTATALFTGTPNTTGTAADKMDVRSADPTALDTSWAVPKRLDRRIFVPANRFTTVTGSPTLAVVQSTPVWSMDAAAVEIVGSQLILPAWWVTFDPFVWWANGGAGTGAASWAFRFDFIDAGQTLGTFSSAFGTGATAAAQDVVVRTTLNGGQANVADKPLLIRVDRLATDGGDTLANDANFIGIELVQST